MSAVCTFVTPSGVHIMADAAFYDEAGVIQGFAPKLHRVPRTNAVFSSRGKGMAFDAFHNACEAVEYDGFDGFRRASAEVFDLYDATMGDLAGEIIVAGWSEENQRGEVLFRHTHQRANTVAGVTYLMGQRAGFGIDYEALGTEFDVDRAVAAFEAARRQPEDLSCGERAPVMGHAVGGFISLATVTADRILWTGIVHRWPEDRVGEKIVPAGLGQAA